MRKIDLDDLLNKYHQGNCSAEELALLETWYVQNMQPEHEISEQQILKAKEEIWANLKPDRSLHQSRRLWTRISAAAVVLISLSVGILFYFKDHTKANSEGNQDKFAKNDISPGGNKAYLTLANGKRIALTDAGTGQLADESGVKISKNAEGQIIYTIENTKSDAVASLTAVNTIETPRGGQYQVLLPDGTKVWLNAASRLTYPVSFVRRERTVELNGEAYFEVARDAAHPFRVKSSGQEIEVLGTHFNVNSYKDETAVRTTLMEGSVRVSSGKGQAIVLSPGEQSSLRGKNIQVTQVNAEDVLDWKYGNFVFNDENLESILRKVARWYNVEIVYEMEPSESSLLGKVSRSKNISAILHAIEQTDQAHFKIEGRRIIVTK